MTHIRKLRVAWLVIGFLLFHLQLFAQEISGNGIATMVENYTNTGGSFKHTDILVPVRQDLADLTNEVSEYSLYRIDKEEAEMLVRTSPGGLSMPLTIDGKNITLQLVRVNIFSGTMAINTSTGNGENRPYDFSKEELGIHYQGNVAGDEQNSIAALSIFKGEVFLIVSSKSFGNYTVGKLHNQPQPGDELFIGYNDDHLSERLKENLKKWTCGTSSEHANQQGGQNKATAEAGNTNKCIEMLVEVDYTVYQYNGSNVANTAAYTIALFNQSIMLYKNEGINMLIDIIFIWTETSPFGGGGSSSRLSNFQSHYVSFSSDLAIMISMVGVHDGVVGAIGGVTDCRSHDDRMCVADLENVAIPAPIPTYSHNIFVVTHEMGHLLGSYHTHACVWNGNNTAIDYCAGYTEAGSCPNPGLPPAGQGTIMSYCPLVSSVGVTLSNGFGPQPGDKIRNSVRNSGCLYECQNCQPFWLLYHSPNMASLYEARDYIRSTVKDPAISNFSVTYTAGGYISLEPGFIAGATNGRFFQAYIQGCEYITPVYIPVDNPFNKPLITETVSKQQTVKIYPNPAMDYLQVEGAENADYSITDMSGRVLLKGKINAAAIDISKLLPGNYIITIRKNDGSKHLEKLSKQ